MCTRGPIAASSQRPSISYSARTRVVDVSESADDVVILDSRSVITPKNRECPFPRTNSQRRFQLDSNSDHTTSTMDSKVGQDHMDAVDDDELLNLSRNTSEELPAEDDSWMADFVEFEPGLDVEGRSKTVKTPPPSDPNRTKEAVIDSVVTIFPDICRDYVADLLNQGSNLHTEQLVAHILDQMEKEHAYPRQKNTTPSRKRKRETDEDEEPVLKYESANREPCTPLYRRITRDVLAAEFVRTPMVFIDQSLLRSQNYLFPAYNILEEAERTWNPIRPAYAKIKAPRKVSKSTLALNIGTTTPEEKLVLEKLVSEELQAARSERAKLVARLQDERQKLQAEEENLKKAKAKGQMSECGCCFSDYPLNRMIYCGNDVEPHFFCKDCARRLAETEIGNSKYELKCMSMDGCDSVFRHDQKVQFLDKTTMMALDRNEQEAMLRMAGIENLETCPFCPYAAEYPPIDENRLFICQAPDCEKVSCRICKLESHIPKSCEENAKDLGFSARREIEEAMTAALIRKCNKCGTPFVKTEGCNKMTCTRDGCHNVQCYICSKSCSYNHFNDRSRGGKPGNCPLFDIDVEERHQSEVQKAEIEAVKKIREKHPEFKEEDLKIIVSERVKRDEERRKRGLPSAPHPVIPAGVGDAGQVLPDNQNPNGLRHQALDRARDYDQRIRALLDGVGVGMPRLRQLAEDHLQLPLLPREGLPGFNNVVGEHFQRQPPPIEGLPFPERIQGMVPQGMLGRPVQNLGIRSALAAGPKADAVDLDELLLRRK